MRRTAALLILAGVALSCSDTREGDALDVGTTPMAVCVPVPEVGDAVFGDLFVNNVGEDPVKLLGASLVDAQGLVLTDAWLVDVAEGELGVGVRHSTDTDGLPAAWADRVSLEGETLPPGDERNLVFVVAAAPEPLASAQAVRLEYTLPNGRSYHQDTLNALLVTEQRDCSETLSEFEF